MWKKLKGWLAGDSARVRDETPAARTPTERGSPQARTALELALVARPDDADLNCRMGLVRLGEGDPVQALDYFHLALHYAPDMFTACAAKVRAQNALGKSSEAADAYRDFLRSNPGHAGAARELAVWHYARGEYAPAMELLRPLTQRRPPDRDACNLLGLILGREFGQFDEAERLLRQALEPDPAWSAALCNLGWILLENGDHAQGLTLLDAALLRNPDDHETRLVRSYMNLKRGDFKSGWRDYEARHLSSFALRPSFDFPPWDGAESANTLLIYGEQGFGDQIMFASCFEEAIARAGRCIIDCDRRLVALFRRSFPEAMIEASAPAGQQSAWSARAHGVDCQIPMGSLPRLWRNRREDFPQHAGYLRAAPERVAYWRARLDELGPGPKIGLSWRGGVAATRRHLRSLALGEFLPLLRLPARFVSLQYGDCGDDLNLLRREHGVILPHWQDAIDDYDETAALVCALDLVISVCTAVIHLAGALGKPVWVLVPAVAEWRYLDRGEKLPWYPSAQLFRQAETGRWQDVITRVRPQLERLTNIAAQAAE